jgi:hypothetical protein
MKARPRIAVVRVRLARASRLRYHEARQADSFDAFLRKMRPLVTEYKAYYQIARLVTLAGNFARPT